MAVAAIKSTMTHKPKMPFMPKMPAKSAVAEPLALPRSDRQQIYTTVDGGRLHVGANTCYAGSINSYNNCVSQFFAKMLGKSVEIMVNNKTRSVEKKDYVKWINEYTALKDVTAKTVIDYLDLKKLAIIENEDRGTMREHLSQAKSMQLFRKLITTMAKDFEASKKYVGKGAAINERVWIRETYGVSFSTLTAGLPEDKAVDIRAGYYTPLLYAAEKGNRTFCEFLQHFKANPQIAGETVQFTKRILEVNPETNIVKSEDFLSSDGLLTTRVTVKTTTKLQIENQVTPKHLLTFNTDTNTLMRYDSKSPVVVEKYSKQVERYSTRYLTPGRP